MSEEDQQRLKQKTHLTMIQVRKKLQMVFLRQESATSLQACFRLIQTTLQQFRSRIRLDFTLCTFFRSIGQSIVEAAVCRLCKKDKLTLQESLKSRQGFHIPMELVCSSCKNTSVPNPTLPEKKVPEINRRAVLAFRVIGAGQKKMEKFCAMMNMPPPLSHHSYDKHNAEVSRVVSTVDDKEMKQAAMRLQEYLRSLDHDLEDGLLDITVSADGTWATCGFTSLHGLVFVISQDTGEILDFTLLSRHCPTCNYHRRRILDNDEFARWKDQHEEECQANYASSSKSMESTVCQILWSCSVSKNRLRYCSYICR